MMLGPKEQALLKAQTANYTLADFDAEIKKLENQIQGEKGRKKAELKQKLAALHILRSEKDEQSKQQTVNAASLPAANNHAPAPSAPEAPPVPDAPGIPECPAISDQPVSDPKAPVNKTPIAKKVEAAIDPIQDLLDNVDLKLVGAAREAFVQRLNDAVKKMFFLCPEKMREQLLEQRNVLQKAISVNRAKAADDKKEKGKAAQVVNKHEKLTPFIMKKKGNEKYHEAIARAFKEKAISLIEAVVYTDGIIVAQNSILAEIAMKENQRKKFVHSMGDATFNLEALAIFKERLAPIDNAIKDLKTKAALADLDALKTLQGIYDKELLATKEALAIENAKMRELNKLHPKVLPKGKERAPDPMRVAVDVMKEQAAVSGDQIRNMLLTPAFGSSALVVLQSFNPLLKAIEKEAIRKECADFYGVLPTLEGKGAMRSLPAAWFNPAFVCAMASGYLSRKKNTDRGEITSAEFLVRDTQISDDPAKEKAFRDLLAKAGVLLAGDGKYMDKLADIKLEIDRRVNKRPAPASAPVSGDVAGKLVAPAFKLRKAGEPIKGQKPVEPAVMADFMNQFKLAKQKKVAPASTPVPAFRSREAAPHFNAMEHMRTQLDLEKNPMALKALGRLEDFEAAFSAKLSDQNAVKNFMTQNASDVKRAEALMAMKTAIKDEIRLKGLRPGSVSVV